MRRRGLILLLTMALTTGFVFPMPECLLSKLNCDRRASSSCPVFAGPCEPEKFGCEQGCPLAESRGEQEKPKKCFEPFVKLKSYPIRALVSLVPKIDWVSVVFADASLAAGDTFQTGCFTSLVNGGERASQIFLQNQSFLF